MIISISGFYGSGGAEMGKIMAEKYGLNIISDEIIEEAVKGSDISLSESVKDFYLTDKMAEGTFSNALMKLQMDVIPVGLLDKAYKHGDENKEIYSSYMDTAPSSISKAAGFRNKKEVDKLSAVQKEFIEKKAEEGNILIFGHCASDILAGRDDILRVFTYASINSCCAQISKVFDLPNDGKHEKLVKRTNHRRAYYFETFTGKQWEEAQNYDITLNTDYLGFDASVELIDKVIQEKFK